MKTSGHEQTETETEPNGSYRVLVTGSSGAVGRVVVEALKQRGHQVRGFDQRSHGELADEVVGDIENADDWERALSGRDTLVHLAATPDDADLVSKLVGPNLVGTYHAFEAAKAHNLRRVVLASTMQVVSGLLWGAEAVEEHEVIAVDAVAPRNHYALTKVWAEHAGAMAARNHGLSVIAARIGWFLRGPAEARKMADRRAGPAYYVSHADTGRFFAVAVEAEHPGFGVYWCVGPGVADGAGTVRSRFDLEPGRRALGYDPRDVFPAGAEALLERAAD